MGLSAVSAHSDTGRKVKNAASAFCPGRRFDFIRAFSERVDSGDKSRIYRDPSDHGSSRTVATSSNSGSRLPGKARVDSGDKPRIYRDSSDHGSSRTVATPSNSGSRLPGKAIQAISPQIYRDPSDHGSSRIVATPSNTGLRVPGKAVTAAQLQFQIGPILSFWHLHRRHVRTSEPQRHPDLARLSSSFDICNVYVTYRIGLVPAVEGELAQTLHKSPLLFCSECTRACVCVSGLAPCSVALSQLGSLTHLPLSWPTQYTLPSLSWPFSFSSLASAIYHLFLSRPQILRLFLTDDC
ncbi:hypothetical protein J6590_036099 [Homalodisca vitripennis]|nr:hypothetical protein J6590_036099 [Homalodisca vitripennis]